MFHRRNIVVLGVCLIAVAPWAGTPNARTLPSGQGAIITGNPAPSPEQIHSLILRAVENQHRDDRELKEFERVEHIVTRKAENAEVVTDITERVVPSGTGTVKLRTIENGVPVSPEQYRQELEFAVNALGLGAHPNERYTDEQEKFERRRRQHAELVDSSKKAFRVTWLGRETRSDSDGAHGPRTLMKLRLEPDPDFKPTTRFATSFQHVHATLWVDEAQAQFARLEADIVTDIPFGGGIAGKVYHGGHIVMAQEEEAPGIWLPTLYDYDVDGRKFLFAFDVHERTEITRYRRVGPPPEAVDILRNELNNLTAVTPSR
ncbi:MAG: hypothetical protein WCA19_10110 [Candidatus Acidiferrales bacterium]